MKRWICLLSALLLALAAPALGECEHDWQWVLDESKPSYDLEALQKKYSGTLIGDYISYFLEKDRNAVEEKALYYGLQALLETSR